MSTRDSIVYSEGVPEPVCATCGHASPGAAPSFHLYEEVFDQSGIYLEIAHGEPLFIPWSVWHGITDAKVLQDAKLRETYAKLEEEEHASNRAAEVARLTEGT